MPAASWIQLCAIIGAAAGSADALVITAAAVVGVGLIARHLQSNGRLLACAALCIAAASGARATASRWQQAHCVASTARATEVRFVTDFDLAPGDAGPAVLRAGECTTPAMLRARIPIDGGRWYVTPAHATPDGSRLRLTVLAADAQPAFSLRPRLRAAGVRRVDSVFAGDAAFARALLLADMHLITPELRQRWSRAGLVHMLSVSGVHVAIIAGALLMLLRAARLTERRATIIALALTAGYVIILGLPPPAVRAAVMSAAVLIARLRQRPASAWSVLTIGALLPVVVDPRAPLDLGWQFSVLGVIALAASARLAKRLGWRGGSWRASLRREFLASIVASAASAPLLVWHFGTLSVVAPLANIVAAPLVTLLQPTLFLALACEPVLPVARFVAGAVHPLLAVLDWIAMTAARPSWAAIDLVPTLAACVVGAVLVAALLVAMVRRHAGTPLLVAGASAALLTWWDLLPARGPGVLELHLLDVGQGDAIALRTPHGRWIVVDAGGGAPGIDHGRRTVLPYLRRLGGTVEAFVLSHPHLDHVGGAPAVIGALRPRRYFDGAFAGATEAYRASLESAAVLGVRWSRVHPGEIADVDGVRLRFLAPDSTWTAGLTDANLASTVVRVEYGSVAMLLVGDAEREEEEWLLAHVTPAMLHADILKVGHHGSRTSSTPAFLDAVAPRLALVSVGRGNSYHHPSPEVLREFARREVPLVRTDVAGTTVIRTDGRQVTITTAARRWRLSSSEFATPSGASSFVP